MGESTDEREELGSIDEGVETECESIDEEVEDRDREGSKKVEKLVRAQLQQCHESSFWASKITVFI